MESHFLQTLRECIFRRHTGLRKVYQLKKLLDKLEAAEIRSKFPRGALTASVTSVVQLLRRLECDFLADELRRSFHSSEP